MTKELVLPILALAALGYGTSLAAWWLFPKTYRGVLVGLLATCVLMILIGALLMLLLYVLRVHETLNIVSDEPLDAVLYFLKLGAISGFVWGPVVLLAGLGHARQVARQS